MTADPVTVVIPGDLHLTEPGLPNHAAAVWAAGEINELVRPDFVQFIGDNVQDGTAGKFALFADLAARLRVPWYALAGDHDAPGDPAAAAFRQHVGEPTGAVSVRGVTGRVDDGPSFDLRPAGDRDWVAPLPVGTPAKGIHRLSVRAETADGPGRAGIEFAADPTGRYTAVPGGRPVVTATNFC